MEHGRNRHVAVYRNPVSMIVGDVGSAKQVPAQGERLGMLAELGGAHCLLVERAPGIDVCADKQEVLFGKPDLGGALGKTNFA